MQRGPNQQKRNEDRPGELGGGKTDVADHGQEDRGHPKAGVGDQRFFFSDLVIGQFGLVVVEFIKGRDFLSR